MKQKHSITFNSISVLGFSPVKLDADWHAAALQMDLRQIKTQTSGHRDCMPSPVWWAPPHIMIFESHTLTADHYLLCVRSFCSRKQGVSSCGESVGSLAGKPRWGCILPTLGGKNIKSWSSFPACTFSESLRESLQDLTVQVDQKHQQKKKKEKTCSARQSQNDNSISPSNHKWPDPKAFLKNQQLVVGR